MAIREKVWKCSDCGTDSILGRHKDCPSCGSPREKGEMRSLTGLGASAAPTVTDPELLKLAHAGSDWFCSHCTAGNIGNGDQCAKCGAPRYATAQEDHPDFAGAHKQAPGGGADAKLAREMNRDPRAETSSSEPPASPPRRPPTPPRPPVDDAPPIEPPRRPWGVVAGAVLLVGLLIGFLVWAFQTHEVEGSVTSMTWTRTIHVESWTNTTVREWKKDTQERAEVQPVNGGGERAGLRLNPSTCRDEHYKTIQVECGSHEECKKIYRTERESYSCTKSESYDCGETCRDLGNGFEDCNPKRCTRDVPDTCTRNKEVFDHNECRNVTDYCDKKLYESKCDYTTQKWVASQDYPSSGSGKDLSWKDATLGPLQRATYSATTSRVISYEDGGDVDSKDYTSSVSRTSRSTAERSASEYLTWTKGDKVVLSVSNLGTVSGEPRRAGAR